MSQPKKEDLGTLVQLDGRGAVRYERVYPHPLERVWRALTEPESLTAWFPTRIEGLREAAASGQLGAQLRFTFPDDDGPELHGELRACDPPRVLEYSWGEELLRFELSPLGAHTKLVFTATFSERSQAPRDATGWHICLDNLRRNLEGEAQQAAGERFGALTAQYLEAIGSDFPDFLKGGTEDELAGALPAPSLEGQVFRSSNGIDAVLVRASRATAIAHRDLPQGGYLTVIEGTLELQLGGHQLRFTQGMEFHIPAGAHVRGHLEEGTRLLFAAPAA